MKTFFCAIAVCISVHANCQNINQRLITINNVASVAQMNAISNPEQRSLVYVTSEQLTYQYIGSQWIPFYTEEGQSYIDSLINVTTANDPQVCCPDAVTDTLKPVIGDFVGCGLIFYIHPSYEWALVAGLDELNGPWGCDDVAYTTSNSSVFNGQDNTATIINAGCSENNAAVVVCNNYSLNGCNDWYLGGVYEYVLLLEACPVLDPILISMGYAPTQQLSTATAGSVVYRYWTSENPNNLTPANNITYAKVARAIWNPYYTPTFPFFLISVQNSEKKIENLNYRPIRMHYF
ncbi:hypothetical protein N8904_01175 [Flavobacteriales bacterium]|nr:hypothetical protein [Flavobacteriales bacterium]MDA7794386.1 hypothetical protein [Flavobacteriales bacterium]